MKYTPVLFVTVVLGLSAAAGVASGAPLTEQQLLNMKAAGISQALIVQQIQSDGIAFPVDPDAMIALKKAGFSDAVLGALLKAQTGTGGALPTPSAPPEKAPPAQAQVDPCDAWRSKHAALSAEYDALENICKAVSDKRGWQYSRHCSFVNSCSVYRKLNAMEEAERGKCYGIVDPQHDPDLASCAEGDDSNYEPDPNLKFRAVQVLQADDSTLSCAALKVLAWTLTDNVAQMDKSVGHLNGKAQALNNKAQTSSQLGQLASVIGGSGAPTSVAAAQLQSSVASQAAGNAQQEAGSIQQIRDSQQKRHDYLMQIYFQKRCND